MKKFDSVYMLELRLYIYKYLLIFAVMTAAYITLFYTRGLKYAGFGFDMVARFGRFDRIAGISFAVSVLTFIVGSIYYYQKSACRFRLLRISFPVRVLSGILVSFTLLVLWYVVTIADIFLVTGMFVKNPAYTGGAQGINFSFLVSDTIWTLIPFRHPQLFLKNAELLGLVSIGCNVPVFICELVTGFEPQGKAADKAEKKQVTKAKNKPLGFLVPGDNIKVLVPVYSVLMLLLTGLGSAMMYFDRFEHYTLDVGGTLIKKVRVRESLLGASDAFSVTIDDVFVGTTIFIVFCSLMVARNYYYFRKDSRSIYLMKRIADAGELHRRCLTVPVAAVLTDLALTLILLSIYYLFYMYNIGVDGSFNLWEVFI